MKITDLKCAIIGQNPVVRITTDAGICGYGQAEIGQALSQAARPLLQAVSGGRGPHQRGARHAAHPAHGQLQALGQRGERH